MNVFQYAASCEAAFESYLRENGYERKTTFYSDYSIGEFLEGAAGVTGTYERAFNEWKDNKVYFTEMVMALNLKSWEWHGRKNDDMAKLYVSLQDKATDYIDKHWSDEDKLYFYQTTD